MDALVSSVRLQPKHLVSFINEVISFTLLYIIVHLGMQIGFCFWKFIEFCTRQTCRGLVAPFLPSYFGVGNHLNGPYNITKIIDVLFFFVVELL